MPLLTGDEETDYNILYNGYDPTSPTSPSPKNNFSLDSLLGGVSKLTNSAGQVVTAIGAGKAAIAGAKSDAQLRQLQLTQGRAAATTDFGATLRQFAPWIIGLVVLAVVGAVVIPLVKSSK